MNSRHDSTLAFHESTCIFAAMAIPYYLAIFLFARRDPLVTVAFMVMLPEILFGVVSLFHNSRRSNEKNQKTQNAEVGGSKEKGAVSKSNVKLDDCLLKFMKCFCRFFFALFLCLGSNADADGNAMRMVVTIGICVMIILLVSFLWIHLSLCLEYNKHKERPELSVEFKKEIDEEHDLYVEMDEVNKTSLPFASSVPNQLGKDTDECTTSLTVFSPNELDSCLENEAREALPERKHPTFPSSHATTAAAAAAVISNTDPLRAPKDEGIADTSMLESWEVVSDDGEAFSENDVEEAKLE